jgi:hypothetical protein
MPSAEVTPRQPYALVIATDSYNDPGLGELRSPSKDAEQLTQVLQDQTIGGFQAYTLVNETGQLLLEEIEGFFDARHPDDLLVLYISCHGVKDLSGRLYFAAKTTKLNRLAASGISADFIYEQVDRCRARKILLLLDCCYSGAYLKGRRPRADGRVGIGRLTGRGRAVITSSTALEYSFEIDTGQVTGVAAPSVFTDALVEGLRTGDADRDGDGLVSVDDLYGYVYDKVREATPHQTPEKKWGEVSGDFIIAKNPHPFSGKGEPLPSNLIEGLRSAKSDVREMAFRELARLAFGAKQGIAVTARETLQVLAEDESPVVSSAAMAALTQSTSDAQVKKRKSSKRRRPRLLGFAAAITVAIAVTVTVLAVNGTLVRIWEPASSIKKSSTSLSVTSPEISALRKYRADYFNSAQRKRLANKSTAAASPSASPSASTTPPAGNGSVAVVTTHLVYEPWNVSGSGLINGVEAISTAKGVNCQGRSDASSRADAYRCFEKSGGILDPCFANQNSENSPELACPEQGTNGVVVAHAAKSLPVQSAVGPASIWLVILSNGAVCNFADGAVGSVAGMLMSFGCSDGSYLYGKIDSGSGTWMIYRQSTGSSSLARVPIATAYS